MLLTVRLAGYQVKIAELNAVYDSTDAASVFRPVTNGQ